jgi:hypothetical protein
MDYSSATQLGFTKPTLRIVADVARILCPFAHNEDYFHVALHRVHLFSRLGAPHLYGFTCTQRRRDGFQHVMRRIVLWCRDIAQWKALIRAFDRVCQLVRQRGESPRFVVLYSGTPAADPSVELIQSTLRGTCERVDLIPLDRAMRQARRVSAAPR